MASWQQRLETSARDWARSQGLTGHINGPWVQPCQDPRHGHFQSTIALAAAKATQQNPRTLAAGLAETFAALPGLEPPQVAGPGFVNLRLTPLAIGESIDALDADPFRGVPPAEPSATIVIDYSSPNVAKEMHVGHIRSTLLGEALARIHQRLGHRVLRDNHIGDWGTQFGKLLLGYRRAGFPDLEGPDALGRLQDLYQSTHAACEADAALLEQARAELVRLQTGDPGAMELWRRIRDCSQHAFDDIYRRLQVRFDHTLGESFYNPWLKQTVRELLDRGIARHSEGAVAVFFDEPALRDKPMLIEKSDGAALYATTDLATLRYRQSEWNPDAILYVTDARQQLHFQQLFAAARRWDIRARLEHITFGAILGADKKPLKTRDGTPLRLRDLLDEAETRAAAILHEKRPELSETYVAYAARCIGIGALKYADLAQNRELDYVFNWDKLLAFDGNTAPYILNAYVRIRAIQRRAGELRPGPVSGFIGHPAESALAFHLLRYGSVVAATAQDFRPHLLCHWLFEAAGLFHTFYEHCPVLKAPGPEQCAARLRLADLTARLLRDGLQLLGIDTLEEM